MYGLLSAVLADKGRNVYTISPLATVQVAVRMMNDYGVGALLVMDRRKPVGIFTERDVLRRVVDSGNDGAATLVEQVMTADPVVAGPGTTVEEAMAVMTERRFRHLPIVEDGEVIGMVSSGDLMRRVTLGQESYIQHLTAYITGAPEGGLAPS
jgi:CBS domain-containing protein